MVNNEMADYRTVYVDVVYIKTDLPLQFVHFSPDNHNGHPYQNFTIQTYGKKFSLKNSFSRKFFFSRKYSNQLYS
jgi:hypothetical protein